MTSIFDHCEVRYAKIHYRGYNIEYNPPPILIRSFDWQFAVDGYDGAPDSKDCRAGSAATLEEAKEQIDTLIEGN